MSLNKSCPQPKSPKKSLTKTPSNLEFMGENIKKVGNYYLTKTLGQGAFSKVKLGIHEKTEEKYAIKILKKSQIMKEGLIEQVKREISIMKLIKHPHVIQLYEVLSSNEKLYLVMELITGGEIFWKVASQSHLSENESRLYYQQLISALDYCHLHGIYHRDLKPENLLLDSNGNLKLSDFGLSAKVGEGVLSDNERKTAEATLLKTRCGTPQYAAPELIKRNGYFGAAVDVWASGVVLFVFLSGNLPFDDAIEACLFQKIIEGKVTYPSIIPDDAKDLLEKIFVLDPTKRITVGQIKTHKWFKVGFQESDEDNEINIDFSVIDTNHAVKHVETTGQSLSVPSINLTSLNAFDLINKAGTLNFTRLIRNSRTQITRPPSYFSTRSEPNVILFRIRSILDDIPYMGYKYTSFRFKVTGKAKAKGFLLFDIIISKVTEQIRMVDFQRVSGSILEFWRIFQKVKKQCEDIISITSPPKTRNKT